MTTGLLCKLSNTSIETCHLGKAPSAMSQISPTLEDDQEPSMWGTPEYWLVQHWKDESVADGYGNFGCHPMMHAGTDGGVVAMWRIGDVQI